MKRLQGFWLLAAALWLQACATSSTIFASSDEPHGIVDLDIAKPASQQYQAFFLNVDGQNIARGRVQLLLRPGEHKVRLGAIIENDASTLSSSGNREADNPVVTIDVKAGMRYSVAAKLEGNQMHEWRAIVTREVPIGGAATP